MAGIEIKVDAGKALMKVTRLPIAVRENLRALLPLVVQTVGASVENKLNSELRSRSSLTVTRQMRESPSRIEGSVGITSSHLIQGKDLLPKFLESGTQPHMIEAVHARALAFWWGKLDRQAFYKRVQHPGTPAYQFLERSIDEAKVDIIDEINRAVREGARKVAA